MSNWAQNMWDDAAKQAEAMSEARRNPITIEDVMDRFNQAVNITTIQNEIIVMLKGAIKKHEDEYPLYGSQDPENCDIELWASLEEIDAIVLKLRESLIQEELKKCILLCSNCHRLEHHDLED